MNYVEAVDIAKFKVEEGFVGKVFGSKKGMLLQDVSAAPRDFLRKDMAMAEGLLSLAFLPYEDSVIELGFLKQLSTVPSLEKPDELSTVPSVEKPDAGGYILEDALISAMAPLQEFLDN